MGVIDVSYKLSANHTIRIEAQVLLSKQDTRDWATGLIEYTFAPNWFLAVIDQYNFGNSDSAKQIHYVTASTGYTKNGNRIMINYGRQRAGIFCVGGVCRNVPASNGLSISILSSF
jgi:hypothetical protein